MLRNRLVGGLAVGLFALTTTLVAAQDISQRPRYLGGWKPQPQQVNYQAPSIGINAQVLPPNQAGNNQPLPQAPNQLSQQFPNGSLIPNDPNSIGSLPPSNFQQPLTQQPQPNYQPTQNYTSDGFAQPATPDSRFNNAAPNQANDPRALQPTMPQQQYALPTSTAQNANERLSPRQVATALPFVTPAPRTGNYLTSAYSTPAVQFANFQNSAPAPNAVAPTQFPNAPGAPPPQGWNVYGYQPTAYSCMPPNAGPTFPPGGAVPSSAAPPTLPPNFTPGMYTPDNAGYTPLFSLGQENYNVLLGRGIIGQPTVYVPGQPVRNFLRYLSP